MNAFARVAWIGSLLVAAGVPVALVSQSAPGQPAAVTTRAAQSLRLGTVDFPTSGSAAAQPHFLHGVAALHSFWYEEALEAFARAVEIDPAFTMAHWGEAMCYFRSYRPGTDLDAGRRALAKIKDTSGLTAREQRYIEALRQLYAGTSGADTKAYAAAMEKLQRAFPDDNEAAAFHALARLALRGKADMEKAGGIARTVYRLNPNHPGAAHYIIHSHDNPAQAGRALDAAHHYSKIAPDAPHALHMPSHIFLQLGMWHEAASSNELGWAASVDYVRRKGFTPTLRDYHNLHWLIYALLQQGRHQRAGELVDEFVRMRALNELADYSRRYIDNALAAYVIETRRWDRAEVLFAETAGKAGPRANGTGREIELCGGTPATTTAAGKNPPGPAASASTGAFIRAYAAAARGVKPGAAEVSGNRGSLVEGVARAQDGDFRTAIARLRTAATAEARTPKPPGPPSFKPAHELLGEVLLSAGKPKEALAEFKIALDRHPGRTLSLLGRARAEAAAGNKVAARATYAQLLEIWKHADADLPEMREAREFVQAAG